jgi:glucose/arabinose dehydrogenase
MARLAAPLGVVAAAFVLTVSLARAGAAADAGTRLIGSFSSPVYVTAPPGDGERVFVVEQAGRIRVVRDGTVLPTPFLDITGPVLDGGERGLLSIAFAPDYGASGLFYAYYTAAPSGDLTIAEFRRSPNPDVAEPSARIVLSIPHSTYSNHNGGQLQFGPDGYLYVATGDGGGGGDPFRAAQKRDVLLGKVLRINPRVGPNGESYTVPPDNPFAGEPGARPEIWAYGLRNPWRFSFDRQTGDLTLGDVGQGGWEEIDFVPAGSGAGRDANFGWSCWEGRHQYQPNYSEPACAAARAGHIQPVWEYPNESAPGCAITGGYVVRDPALPALQGRYIYGDYCDDRVWSVVLQVPNAEDNRETGLTVANLTSFGEDACGRVYAVSHLGPVYRLEAPGAPSAHTCTPAAQPSPPPPPPGSPPPQPQPQPQPTAPAPQPARPTASCRVPRVIGLRLPTARTRIRRASCRVGRIRYRGSQRPRGRVLTQAPRPGARRPAGATVRFTVSRGRRQR